MRREDIFMDIIGELDDKYIALAIPLTDGSGAVSSSRNVIELTPVKVNTEVSKKDLRIYWMTRALGMAAVTVLIVGAVFLLWKNWDKIAAKDPDRPTDVTTVTTVNDPSVITTDIDDGGKTNAPSVTFEEIKQMLYYKGSCITLPCSVFDITRLDSSLTASAESGDDGSSTFYIRRNDELVCTLKLQPSPISITPMESSTLSIHSGEDFSLFDGKIKLGTTLEEVKALFGEPTHNDESSDYSYEFTSSGETIAIYNMRFDDDGRLMQMPDISYIGDAADRFEQITDTSMPEDPFPYNDPDYYYWFYGMWSRNFSTVRNSVGYLGDPEKRATLDSVNKARYDDTPYTLYDNLNLYWYRNWLGISANELCEAIENDNATYLKMRDESGYIPDDALYTDEEISVLRSGSRTELIAQFATEYDIIVGEHVFNPKWLYYHITADYYDAGITPEMIKEIYPLYKQAFYEGSWKMTDEAWSAFDAKLQEYMGITSVVEETDSNNEESDRFEQITDTSMPDLITGYYDDDSYFNFEFPWKLELRSIPIELMRLVDESETDKWFESVNTLNSGTPYRINRGYNLYSYVTGVGLSWEEAAPILERDFSADEISAIVSGDMGLITKNSASEFTIVIGDCAYSPKWLYYHTTDDYAAVGITAAMINAKLEKYRELGLPEEMWNAFRDKLLRYIDSGHETFDGMTLYPVRSDQELPMFNERSLEIFESVFYGVWKHEDESKNLSDLYLTYSEDYFDYGYTCYPGSIVETDELYALTFVVGGELSCYTVFKNEPGVLYSCAYNNYIGKFEGYYTAVYISPESRKYTDRTQTEMPYLSSGKLSNLGQKKLFYTYGKAFEDSFNAALEKDESEGIETGMGTAYIYHYEETPRYLADFTDDTVDMLLPYYYENSDGSKTVIYAVKSFAQNYKGEWDAVNIWTNEGIAPLYDSSKASSATIPADMLGEFDLDALTEKVFSGNGTLMSEMKTFLDGLSDKGLAAQYRRAFALGTAGCRDMEDYENDEVLRRYYGNDYESSGKRAVIYSNSGTVTDDTSANNWVNALKDHLDSVLSDESGTILGKSSGYSFASVMNAYLRTFSASYINDVFPQLPFCRYGDELFYRDASMVIPDCHFEFGYNGDENRAVIEVMGYAKDKATGEKTDEIIYGIEAIFDKTSEGWKCSRFNPHSIAQ